MAAGQGFKTFTTGEVLTAGDVNGYLMQGINVFTNATARDAAITAPAEGQFAFTKDNNSLWYYDGAAWVASGATGDIEGVTAGVGISGGGTSGTVTVTNSMATAIDAKGDLVPGTGADTFARLAVGANDTVLTADSSTATGLKWAAAGASGSANVAGKNFILNSGFNVWQRGTSFSAAANTSGYYADRWMCDTNPSQASTFSRQVTGDTTNLPNIQYCIRFQRNSGQTGTGVQQLVTSMETVNSIPLAGKTVTLSFYARAGANYSPASNALVYRLSTGTGTDQNALTVGYTGLVNAINETATLTTTWQRFTATATIATNASEAAVTFRYSPTGTAGANDYFEVTGVQLEIAGSASAYSPNTSSYATELAACQRYYYLHASGNGFATAIGYYANGTNIQWYNKFPVTMRVAPALVMATGTDFYQSSNGGDNFNSGNISAANPNGALIFNNTEASGTAGQSSIINTNNASASIAFSAEL